MAFQYGNCFFVRNVVVKFDTQHAFFKFAVVDDSDVFQADRITCQNGGNGGDTACLVHNVAVDGIGLLSGPEELVGIESR